MRTVWWFTFVLSMVLAPAYADAGTILDPSGDSTSHDIVSIDGTFDATTLLLTANFAPGTLDPTNLAFFWGLDTDLDFDTGVDCAVFTFPCGAEWSIVFNVLNIREGAALVVPGVEVIDLALFPVSFGIDTFSIVVPLDPDPLIGLPDDGFALFGLVVGEPASMDSFFAFDFTPENNGPLGGPTMLIPEPNALTALGSGIAMLALLYRRRRHSVER